MQPIGWTLACVLLATSFSKSAISSVVENVRVPTASQHQPARGKVTKLLPIANRTALDPDVRQLRDFFDDLFSGRSKSQETTAGEARTFGMKRLQFMLMPMMYKMGVMMTMLTVLTVISLKGLLIGATLLVLKLGTIIAKFSSGWQQHHAQAWSPQPVHVHVHNSLPVAHNQPYAGWMHPHSASGPEDEEHYYYRG
ncbi:uncharacterized protein LOC143375109 [Andrena cerasifolii]|uniref:uncharacterized protein LOC143375109 n=1 Tax=Andrena cerasifolii TaxID=2819439 RepID=UPI0040378550